jgi:acyl-CoA thioester hydrolase
MTPEPADPAAAQPRLSDFPVVRPIPTRWMDNDVYGHVNNVTYYSYFDTAVNGWLMTATGCDIRALPAIGVVAETSCRYYSELSFPETISAGLALERLGRSSVIYRIGLFGHGHGPGHGPDPGPGHAPDEPPPRLAAVGRFVHVYVDRTHRRPVAVPAQIRAALAALE